MTDKELAECCDIQRLRRKRDQEWDMAGLARQDGDAADAARHTELALKYQRRIAELYA